MATRPSDEALAAAVGAPGKKIKKLSGGPYFWRFECDGRARELLVLDGQVAPKGLASVGRYLQSVGMLDHKKLTVAELMNVVSVYGELPKDFDFQSADSGRFAYGPPPGLAEHPIGLGYGSDRATLILYAIEPQPAPPTLPPGMPQPASQPVGARPPVQLRATLPIGRDYKLQWHVERYNSSTKQWEPR
jgi:hypothetical protein